MEAFDVSRLAKLDDLSADLFAFVTFVELQHHLIATCFYLKSVELQAVSQTLD